MRWDHEESLHSTLLIFICPLFNDSEDVVFANDLLLLPCTFFTLDFNDDEYSTDVEDNMADPIAPFDSPLPHGTISGEDATTDVDVDAVGDVLVDVDPTAAAYCDRCFETVLTFICFGFLETIVLTLDAIFYQQMMALMEYLLPLHQKFDCS